MPLRYNGTTIGTITVAQEFGGEKHRFNLQIRQGNCLAVILHVRKCTEEEKEKHGPKARYMHNLYSFFVNEQHLKNMIKEYGRVLDPINDVLSIKLNMFYKENYTLLKYFVKSGYKVTCYYKEEKK